MGLRAGKGAAASAYRRGADVWKVLRAALVATVELSARAPDESNLEAMLAIGVWLRREGWCVGGHAWRWTGGWDWRAVGGSLDVTFIDFQCHTNSSGAVGQ